MHEIWVLDNDRFINVTPLVSKISWTSNVDSLGEKLSFDMITSDSKYIPNSIIDVGSIIILQNGEEELFRGEVITERINGRDSISYDAFDFAFFLNKSKDIYQFNDMLAHDAIKKILMDYGVPIGEIATIPLTINKIFANRRVSDIIKDILVLAKEQTNNSYHMEMCKGKLDIYKEEDAVITATFKLADNLAPHNIMDFIENPSRTRSIENMKNSIKIICDKELVTHNKSDELINKYGLLQEVITISQDEKAKALETAKNLLNDLGRISEDNSLSLPGNDIVRAGRLINITEAITGMEGLYLIKSCTHSIEKGTHFMSLGLDVKDNG